MHVPAKRFLDQYRFALIGFSRSGKKFGNYIYRKLTTKGLHIYPINPAGGDVDGIKTYKSLTELPVKPQAVIIAVKASSVETAVREVIGAGIKLVWIIGSGYTKEIAALCRENGIELIHNRCILMYFGGFPHNLHYLAHRMWRRVPRLRPSCTLYDTLGEWLTFRSEADGTEQRYWLGLPEDLRAEKPNLMALYLHQQGSDWSGVLTSGMYEFCRKRGIIAVSTDYRGPDSHLSRAALGDMRQILRTIMDEYNVTLWIATGVSMGAIASIQLTYLLPPELRPAGVVAVLPIYDIPSFFREADEEYREALLKSYGGTPEENPEEYARRSPHGNLAGIDPSIPFAVFVGTEDEVVSIDTQGRRLAEALEKNGNPLHYRELNVGHDPEVFAECYEEGVEFVLEAASSAASYGVRA